MLDLFGNHIVGFPTRRLNRSFTMQLHRFTVAFIILHSRESVQNMDSCITEDGFSPIYERTFCRTC